MLRAVQRRRLWEQLVNIAEVQSVHDNQAQGTLRWVGTLPRLCEDVMVGVSGLRLPMNRLHHYFRFGAQEVHGKDNPCSSRKTNFDIDLRTSLRCHTHDQIAFGSP